VKEQQKRIGAAEFRNTHFSFTMCPEGIEQFVSTPELHNENSIGSDPLPAGQVWALSPGGTDENPGLFRIEVSEGPGSGLKILNQSPPGPVKSTPLSGKVGSDGLPAPSFSPTDTRLRNGPFLNTKNIIRNMFSPPLLDLLCMIPL
jgi:predicted ATP-dependent Lon-type protease